MTKQMVFDEEARQYLAAGVSKLTKAVRSTLGPRGRNAVLDKGWGSPKVTKDGVANFVQAPYNAGAIGYAVIRFGLTFYRQEVVVAWGLQEAQVIALATGVLALGVLIWRSTRRPLSLARPA